MSTLSAPPAPVERSPTGPARFAFVGLSASEPVRAELYGIEHLEAHARQLAEACRLATRDVPGDPLLRRFVENGQELARAHRHIVEANRRQEALTTDAEWLLDNFHIIEDNLREVRRDLPRGYYKELPKLADGPYAFLPRVYALGLELVAHTDSSLDENNITRFVQAFQTVAPLAIGELWAVPIMLRLVLLENLRRLSGQMLFSWQEQKRGGEHATRLLTLLRPPGLPLPDSDHQELSDPCVVRLLQALRDHGPDASPCVEWLEQRLSRRQATPTEVLRREHQRQAANQVSVGNSVTSLRLLANLDWSLFFERTSVVEAVLRNDPAGVYARQDFPTKDRYRRTVERLARRCDGNEIEVANRALALARRGQAPEDGGRKTEAGSIPGTEPAVSLPPSVEPRNHVGYYLVDAGRTELYREVRYRPRLVHRLLDTILAHPNLVYFGSLTAMTGLLLSLVLLFAATRLGATTPLLLLTALAVLLPVSDLAVGLVHHLLTLALPPRVLPKLDFKEGIPPDGLTFVVMPTMLLRPESAASLADRLEVHYLSNPDPQLRFALLTDFADAPTEHQPEDDDYLRLALERIKALNERYAAGGPDRFFLCHRRRVWNPAQGCWMGWERKRGKLSEFNRLLRGAKDTSYMVVSGDLGRLPPVRFVITLDADTQLPRETARRLVATLAHPLNRPRFDPRRGRVVAGYGVLQPRVSLSLLAQTRSLFSRILASSAGIDPYTTAVSDVYQDLFGRGTFTGKGIYDVDAFEAAAGHTFPENAILSHDLIEGNYARCGLATDIELLDDFPARYHVYARREHRWVRGDWQILPWLFRKVPAPEGRRKNPLPLLERWKVFDNLRRSLVPPALIVLVTLGWTALPGSPWFWTGLALLVPALPLVLLVVNSLLGLIRERSWRLQLRDIRGTVGATGGQVVLSIIFLADQARLLVDAIVRTLVRMAVTRRHLLEWETAASTERRLGTGFLHFCVSMWPGPALAVLIGLLVFCVNAGALAEASSFLAAWFLSPLVAYVVSRPRARAEPPLTADERRELRRLARKTWYFFETFVTGEDHWLPPDNYQEDPKGQVAHRTSPTNVGLYLLSSLAAQDFGYLTLSALADRLEKTLDTLGGLDRFRGHFYNWYNTRTLDVLQPSYVSTVDSGNLLGCLLTLRQGLLEKTRTLLPGDAAREGLADTLRLVAESARALEPPRETADAFQQLEAALRDLNRLLDERPADLLAWGAWLDRVGAAAAELAAQEQHLARALGEEADDLHNRVRRFTAQVRDQRAELDALAPWLTRLRIADCGSSIPEQSAIVPVALAERWQKVCRQLTEFAAVADLQSRQDALLDELASLEEAVARSGDRATADRATAGDRATAVPEASRALLADLRAAVRRSAAPRLLSRLEALAERAAALAAPVDFRFLYNEQRHLFTIGFNCAAGRFDNAHYDLLASESCLTSFLAIARGDVPKRHWFQLGRQITQAGGGIALLSWGGTMFEYLMPRLLLPTYPGTLLDESARTAVDRQIEYGRQCHVPWGISESGFNALDAALDYQYQSFGVPGLGLKRGLSRDLVIAPYAAALALIVRPHAALANLRALAAEGGEGSYGLYEAVDYTRERLLEQREDAALRRGEGGSRTADPRTIRNPPSATRHPQPAIRNRRTSRASIVRSYMTHHQGMSLVALADCLLGDVMPRRFHHEPIVRATDLLLQERVPRVAPVVEAHEDEATPPPVIREGVLPMSRRLTTPDTPLPRTHVLSNGRYAVVLTNAGSGASTWQDLDVTRWHEDRTCDGWGPFCYVRNLADGSLWSAGHQPVCHPADKYEVTYSTDKAEFLRRDGAIETHLEVTVSPENDAEVRRLTLTNHGTRTQELELTSYAEVVLAPHRADLAHPAFGKLFLETEFVPAAEALLCRRRPRAADQKPLWCVHVLAVDGPTMGTVEYETDRARFLGRGRTPARPAALDPGTALSGTTGAVLDPVVSLRRRVRIAPGNSVSVAFTTAVASTRQEALALADHYHDFHGIHRAFELAWAHTQLQLRHHHLTAEEVHLFQRLAAHIIYAGPTLRAPAAVAANRQGQPALWRHGISGDKPILLVQVVGAEDLNLVRQLLLAHTYWRLQGLEVDCVLLNEHPTGYAEELQQQLQNLVRASDSHALIDKPGGIFLRKTDHLSPEDKVLLLAAARVVLAGDRGSLTAQIDQQERRPPLPDRLAVSAAPPAPEEAPAPPTPGANGPGAPALQFANGFGGFSADGREYIVAVADATTQGAKSGGGDRRAWGAGRRTLPALPPAPWINVVANPRCGFLVSESGGGYTWAGNSQMNRLTPWNNDPVSDPPGEVVYLRDEDTGDVWTPTPLPLGAGPARVRHGQGYTVFEQTSYGLSQELVLFVPPDDPLKILHLKVRNTGNRPRRLSATFYAEWVLGTVRDQAPMYVVTELDPDSGALLARNAFNTDFGAHVAFADVSLRTRTCTADRTEFLGRNGSVHRPAALERVALSGRTGEVLDPCAALMTPFDLKPGQEREVVFFLGEGASADEVRRLLHRYREPGRVQAAFEEARQGWDRMLTTLQVRTPDPGMDLLLNRWLLYQVLGCRAWARSAFYQSGGAYGFRDQLQDVMALVCAAPQETRAQLLRAAARQFLAGDVQHWWHPPAGRGVRTRFSDDFLWLPLAAHHYVTTTGDAAVLDEQVPFLRGPALRPEQEEDYGLPEVTPETATLYEHCVRAIDHGVGRGSPDPARYGQHGLPLMGTGDWNDGMNKVGAEGKGESVWDGWFQLTILPRFADLAERRGDAERAARYRQEAARLRAALEANAWDGQWYRRAYFDDGTPLGSAQNDECQIDSLAQTWAVISGAADPERARSGMRAVEERLVRPADGLILLFTPPFDKGTLQPGYIKGYVPGIRENGGQYTHAATWVVQATALLGHGNRAVELFNLISPVSHTSSPAAVARYKVEPYVVAADVYGVPPHIGRGGWTWYTGSASWLYRVALETILGFRLEGGRLRLEPCIPTHWPRFEITYQYRSATYHIAVENPDGVERGVRDVTVDGTARADAVIPLTDDGQSHEVRVVLG